MKKIFEDVEENTTEGFLEDLRSKAPEYFNSEGKFTGKGGSITVDGKKIQIPREIFMANKLETLKHKPNNPIGNTNNAEMFGVLLDTLHFDNSSKYEIREKDDWKPSYKEPIPRIRCTATSIQTGQQCAITAKRGSLVCYRHGADYMIDKKKQEEAIEAARVRLIGMSDQAIDVIHDILLDLEVNENTRLKAAQDILDRSGVKPGVNMTVEVNHNHNIASEMRDQMMAMRQPKEIEMEAEIVSED